ncbi:hypothetical protein ACS0TY_011637 [Phlomoides rotata]
MKSHLTKLEMDAVFQLIQLSGTSDEDSGVVWKNFPVTKDEEKNDAEEEEESRSAVESLSSNYLENCSEPLPRRNPKFGSLLHIYKITQPLIKNRSRKRPRF